MKKKVLNCVSVKAVPSIWKEHVLKIREDLLKKEGLSLKDIVEHIRDVEEIKHTLYILSFEDGTTMVSMQDVPKGTSVIYKPYEK